MDDADRIIGLYQRRVREYDRERSRSLFERGWLDKFTGLVRSGGHVLDIGCGTGEPIARYLIERGCSVTGVDSATAMVELCARRFPAQQWRVADMRTLSLGRRFDGLLAWDSFFHLRAADQRAMFAIFAAHAAPGAALMFTSGPAEGVAIGEFHGEPLFHASLDASEYRALLLANGFSLVETVAEDPDCGGHTVWLARQAD